MLKEMEYVYAVYQEKSFSKAAEKLFVSQPALSLAIKKAEAEIRLPLFDRSTNPIQLTPAGEIYIGGIEKIMAIQAEMKVQFERLLGEQTGTVTIGAATFFCAHVLPGVIREFRTRYPGYVVHLVEAHARDLVKYLQAGTIDYSLDVEGVDNAVFEAIEWEEEQIILAVPAHFSVNEELRDYRLGLADLQSRGFLHPDVAAVGMEQFRDQPFILLKQGNDLYRRGMRLCRNAGFMPQVAIYMDQLLTSYYAACNGTGIAFVRAGIADYIEQSEKICFYKIADAAAVRRICLYRKKTAELRQPLQDFQEFIKAVSPFTSNV